MAIFDAFCCTCTAFGLVSAILRTNAAIVNKDIPCLGNNIGHYVMMCP